MRKKMGTSFNPTFIITPALANDLMRIEAVKQAIQVLPSSTKQNVWQRDVRTFPRRPFKNYTLWSLMERQLPTSAKASAGAP